MTKEENTIFSSASTADKYCLLQKFETLVVEDVETALRCANIVNRSTEISQLLKDAVWALTKSAVLLVSAAKSISDTIDLPFLAQHRVYVRMRAMKKLVQSALNYCRVAYLFADVHDTVDGDTEQLFMGLFAAFADLRDAIQNRLIVKRINGHD